MITSMSKDVTIVKNMVTMLLLVNPLNQLVLIVQRNIRQIAVQITGYSILYLPV